jgi:hypothetical protein
MRGKGCSRRPQTVSLTSVSTHGIRGTFSPSGTVGNGMTASFLAARMLVDLYQHGDKRAKTRRIANLFAFDRARR